MISSKWLRLIFLCSLLGCVTDLSIATTLVNCPTSLKRGWIGIKRPEALYAAHVEQGIGTAFVVFDHIVTTESEWRTGFEKKIIISRFSITSEHKTIRLLDTEYANVGLPWRSFAFEMHNQQSTASTSVHGLFALKLGGYQFFFPMNPRAIPFFTNSCIYATIYALVLAFWISLRRRRRILTGRCIRCGYSLAGSTFRCPECGALCPESLT